MVKNEQENIDVVLETENKTDVKENVVNETNIKEHEEEKIVKTLHKIKKLLIEWQGVV